MSPRRIQTTLLTSPRKYHKVDKSFKKVPPDPAPQFAEKPDLTDMLAAKYGGIQEEQSGPPESAFKPHKVYVSPYEDAALQELIDKINRNKIKQGKRWKKMIRKIQKRAQRDKYMIPLSDSEQIKGLKKERIFRQAQKPDLTSRQTKLKVKTAKKVPPVKTKLRSKRCEVLGKVQTKIAGYSYKHKKTGKTVTVGSYTKKVLKCLDK